MNRAELVTELSRLMAGLQVPISLGMQLGVARESWVKIADATGFGWRNAEDFEAQLYRILDPTADSAIPAGAPVAEEVRPTLEGRLAQRPSRSPGGSGPAKRKRRTGGPGDGPALPRSESDRSPGSPG